MSGIDLAQAEARLQQYLNAEEKVLRNQSYEIGDRTYTRADMAAIQKGIDLWNRRCQELSVSGRGRSRTMIVKG